MSLKAKIESLLFVSIKPLSVRKIAELTKSDMAEVAVALEQLKKELNQEDRGIHLMTIGERYELSSNPVCAALVRDYLKDEQRADLTRPALETLTIIAYRGPIAKADLDLIRGVNCALILRNLLIKGLIETIEDKQNMLIRYQVTFDLLKFLGVSETKDLPDFIKLNQDENLAKILHPDLEPATVAEKIESPERGNFVV